MPTTLKRTTINHVAAVQRGLDLATLVWPEDAGSDGALMQRIIVDWSAAAEEKQAAHRAQRAARVWAGAGVVRGVYGSAYLDDLREEWRD